MMVCGYAIHQILVLVLPPSPKLNCLARLCSLNFLETNVVLTGAPLPFLISMQPRQCMLFDAAASTPLPILPFINSD